MNARPYTTVRLALSNSECADEPAHPRRLVSTFAARRDDIGHWIADHSYMLYSSCTFVTGSKCMRVKLFFIGFSQLLCFQQKQTISDEKKEKLTLLPVGKKLKYIVLISEMLNTHCIKFYVYVSAQSLYGFHV